MAIIIPPTPNSYLTRDEYTILRHSQDNHLTREFAGLHHSIDGIKRELKEFKEDVKLQFTAVDQRFNAVDQRLDIVQLQLNENTAEIRQSAAYSRNSSIKNPYQRITPLVAYRPAHGLADPDLDFFPKTADEFYKLRSPITSAQRKMLHYLINFYDLTNDPSILPVDRSVDDGDIDPSPFPYDPVRAVESIEVVLGLDEEKIIAFKQRAQQYAAQTLHLPSKRPNIASNNELEHLARRPKFDPTSPTSRHPVFPAHQTSLNTTTSDGLDRTRLGLGDRSTPSSRRPRIHDFRGRKTESPPESLEDDRTSQDSSDRDDPNQSSQQISAKKEASLPGDDAVISQSRKSKQDVTHKSDSPTMAYTATPERATRFNNRTRDDDK